MNSNKVSLSKMVYDLLESFKQKRKESQQKRIESGEIRKAFSKDATNAGTHFAFLFCKILKENGINVLSEKENRSLCSFKCKTEMNQTFKVNTDAVILDQNSQVKIALEIKYMEEGIMYSLDTKKIAYDYLHFRRSNPNIWYVVISGGKLAMNNDSRVEKMLYAFSDRFFDINIWEINYQEKIKELIEWLHSVIRNKTKPKLEPQLIIKTDTFHFNKNLMKKEENSMILMKFITL